MSDEPKRVYKYPLQLTDWQTVYLPRGARILTAREQGTDTLCLWALVSPLAPTEPRRIRVHGTGHAVLEAEHLKYLGTGFLQGGALVFHVFEHLADPYARRAT